MITIKARVQKIITDKLLHEKEYKKYGEEESIGGILYTLLDDPTPLNFDTSNLPFAKPLYTNISCYPVPGEIVDVLLSTSQNHNENPNGEKYYLPPLKLFRSPTSNALPNALDE